MVDFEMKTNPRSRLWEAAAWINHPITSLGLFQNEAQNEYYNLIVAHDQNPPSLFSLLLLPLLLHHLPKPNASSSSPHQKQCNSWSQYKSSHYIWTVVSILWNSVEAGEEGGAECAQTEHWFGQAAGLGLDCTGDVHLEGERWKD